MKGKGLGERGRNGRNGGEEMEGGEKCVPSQVKILATPLVPACSRRYTLNCVGRILSPARQLIGNFSDFIIMPGGVVLNQLGRAYIRTGRISDNQQPT